MNENRVRCHQSSRKQKYNKLLSLRGCVSLVEVAFIWEAIIRKRDRDNGLHC